jgi:choline dehydrogenase
MPGGLKGSSLENFVRNNATTYSHESCTAKMGRDEMSVVDNHLKVYGIDNLRIADASILPHAIVGGPMGPCVVIGERAGEILKSAHKL